ncbi:MAG: 1,2-dihydroxy-3-keto-5-methylthiopentene dioxygenase [Pseudomonadota bacterium]
MSRLTVYSAADATHPILAIEDGDTICRTLADAGVLFRRWAATAPLEERAEEAAILAAYRPEIDRLVAEAGYQSMDVVNMYPDHPDRVALRQKFLSEHTHGEDEVRFFVEGAGLFCLHLDERVYAVLCTKGDLISVPAGTRHWFDMGDRPRFTAIRLFNNPDGWIARFTGDTIAERFPRLD